MNSSSFTLFVLFQLQTFKVFILNGFYCHALHLNKPFRTADRCTYNDCWLIRESLPKQLADYSIVATVAQVDNEMSGIIESTVSFAK